ncbi:MAG: MucR family transcriptional regulator [Syntrophobacteraceae bacterium]|nr:MucR family transcriptional regulator [Syntrophobacteraceae bacterium]
MTRRLLEIAADIVQAQATVAQMTADQIELALLRTFGTLQKMQKAEDEGTLLDQPRIVEESIPKDITPERLEAKDSIQEDKIICMECGAEMRQLTTKHLGSHGLDPRGYKKKWGFSLKQPLSAKSLTRARSMAAKKRGLPEALVRFQRERKQKKSMGSPEEPAPADSESTSLGKKVRTIRRPRKTAE